MKTELFTQSCSSNQRNLHIPVLLESVDKKLLEEQFAEGICLPGKRQQLLLAVRQQKESKPPRQTEMSMCDWFQENDISSY